MLLRHCRCCGRGISRIILVIGLTDTVRTLTNARHDDVCMRCRVDQLDSLYNVAGIELAVANSSHWASLLSSDDLSLLEYATDLKVCFEDAAERG